VPRPRTVIAREDRGAAVAARYTIARSAKWSLAEQRHLATEPFCVGCRIADGARMPVRVHHVFPFHVCVALGRPDLEIDARNLVTMCHGDGTPDHHRLIGHLDDFESMNFHVRYEAARTLHAMSPEQLRRNVAWQALVAHRPPRLHAMTDEDRRQLQMQMALLMPPK
jgi:hypothetical protein